MEEKHPDDSVHREFRRVKIEKYKDQWETCCSRSSRDVIKYFSQLGICSLVLIFCMVQLILKTDNTEVYFSLISSIISLYIPSPKLEPKI